MKNTKWFQTLAGFLAGFIAGALAGMVIYSQILHSVSQKEVREGQIAFINPLLECEDGGDLVGRELASFLPNVRKVVASAIKEEKAVSIGVYFRDLNNGPWFGISENEPFIPASLLKVPLMMAYLKQAESNPSILKKKLVFKGKIEDTWQNIRTMDPLKTGQAYSVQELISRMIIHSDNDAADLLLVNDRDDHFDMVFRDLGLAWPRQNTPEFNMSVKDYASLFRVLYNGSYLNKEMSNRSLELLSQTYFRGGIVAGVPRNIPIAHKFGERRIDGQMQFHDCGIVYYPEHAYLLCVMCRGRHLADMVSAVQDISRAVYTEVDRQIGAGNR